MKRYGITLRRTTTVCQRPPADYEDKLVQFVFYVGHLLDTENYDKSMIFGCDETAVWIDPPSSTTLAHRGAKDVPVSSLGHSKIKITFMLTGKANGSFLPTLCFDQSKAANSRGCCTVPRKVDTKLGR